MTEMSIAEIARFLMQGTFTGKLATVKKDGSSHVVPIWFVLDNENSRGKIGNIIFTTGEIFYNLTLYEQWIRIDSKNFFVTVVIEESKRENVKPWHDLSCSFEPDLSHAPNPLLLYGVYAQTRI